MSGSAMGAGIDRRGLLAAGMAVTLAARGVAATPLPAGVERVLLWPGDAPGSAGVQVVEQEIRRRPDGPAEDTAFVHVTRPTLTHVRPAKPNGAALLIVPGGGYLRVAVGIDGMAIAHRLAEMGYHVFVLVYRLPADGWAAGPDAPLQDAQRAMRLIRAQAGREGFDAARVGVLGFSAGGHLAARLATVPGRATYAPVDAADTLSAAPGIAGLFYPVILMDGPQVHKGSRDQLLGPDPRPADLLAYSAERGVTAQTPPTFLAAAGNDPVVPVANSLAMYQHLHAAGVAAEMHLFETGGHGFGLRLPDGTVSPWPELLHAWLGRHGMA